MPTLKIPAVYLRGGTSKGVFFRAADLPTDPAERDRLLLRVIGSPDPYGKQIDGMGGASSSTSKVVIVTPSARPDCDVDYLFGQVAIDAPVIDWSGNCGNLTAAVGPFAIEQGWVNTPTAGPATVRIWQANLGQRILAEVSMQDGEVQESGDFELDGVTFPAAEIRITFLEPGGGHLLPTGHAQDRLDVPGVGIVDATLITAGNPTIFIAAATLGLTGIELQADINNNPALLARCETIRAYGAVVMGLAADMTTATEQRPHTPKLAFIAAPQDYTASSGKPVSSQHIDLSARILSMGKLHHAMTGTGAVALAAAAAIPGTLVAQVAGVRDRLCFGHPSGTLTVGAVAAQRDREWTVVSVSMSRSARRLMAGWVYVPETGAGSEREVRAQ